MTSAYILILAILVLGGLIASLGDRLGTKVGKARLSLFNLRPKQTAIVVTVVTGTLISASTLGILFALSKSLRQGVFELDDIIKKRQQAQAELSKVTDQKRQVEKELKTVKEQQVLVQSQFLKINQNYSSAVRQLKSTIQQSNQLRTELRRMLVDRTNLLRQRSQLVQQMAQLRTQIRQQDQSLQNTIAEINKKNQRISQQETILKDRKIRLQALESRQQQLEQEIQKQDTFIATLDQQIASKDQELSNKENQLNKLEEDVNFLNTRIADLSENYRSLREGEIAISQGQVLSFGVVKVVDPTVATQVIDQLLNTANRKAIFLSYPDDFNAHLNERVVQIARRQVDEFSNKIKDGKEYVVMIRSGGNYLRREARIYVFADAILNREIYRQNEELSSLSLENITDKQDLQEQVNSLLISAQIRARNQNLIGEIQLEDNQVITLINFLNALSNLSEDEIPDELKIVTLEKTYIAGPLKMRMLALKEGRIILSTEDFIK